MLHSDTGVQRETWERLYNIFKNIVETVNVDRKGRREKEYQREFLKVKQACICLAVEESVEMEILKI